MATVSFGSAAGDAQGSRTGWTRRATRLAVAAVALAGALTLATPPAASAHPGFPSPVYDPQTVEWDFVYDRTSAQFAADFAERVAQGYMVIDFEPDPAPRVTGDFNDHMGAVFQKNTDGRLWRSMWGMTAEQLVAERIRAASDNLRMVDFETYRTATDGPTKFAAVWVENRENYETAFSYAISQDTLALEMINRRLLGQIPIDIKAYTHSDCFECYAVIWLENRENLGWQAFWHLRDDEFSVKFDELRDAGLRPLAFQAVFLKSPTISNQMYSGVWVENRSGRRWAQYRDLSPAGLEQKRQELAEDGYRPVAYERYRMGSNPLFAVIWREN
jgi:Bacterial tandem repeat domain 1